MANNIRRNRRAFSPVLTTMEERALLSGQNAALTLLQMPYDLHRLGDNNKSLTVGPTVPIRQQTVTKMVPLTLSGNAQYTFTNLAHAEFQISRLRAGPSANPHTIIDVTAAGGSPFTFSWVDKTGTHQHFHVEGNADQWATFHVVAAAEASQTEQVDHLTGGQLTSRETSIASATVQYDKFISVHGKFTIDVDISLTIWEGAVNQPYQVVSPSNVPTLNQLRDVDATATVTENVTASREYGISGALVTNVTASQSLDPQPDDHPAQLTTASTIASYKLEKGVGKFTATIGVSLHDLAATRVDIDAVSSLSETSATAQAAVTAQGAQQKLSGNLLENTSSTRRNGAVTQKLVPLSAKPSQTIQGMTKAEPAGNSNGFVTTIRQTLNDLRKWTP